MKGEEGSSDRDAALVPSILSVIGGTPLVELSRVTRGFDGRMLAKLDHLNPGGSEKDRIAAMPPGRR